LLRVVLFGGWLVALSNGNEVMQKNLEALAAVYQAVASLILVMDEVVLDRADAEKFARMNEDEWAVVAKILQDLFAACDDCRGIDQQACP
jgi:hypothetical protein